MTPDELATDLAIVLRSQETMQTFLLACQRDPLAKEPIETALRIRQQLDHDLTAARTRLREELSC